MPVQSVASPFISGSMYLRYFGFSDHPFALTPDPGFLFLSPHHREALGHLVYGTGEHGGFVQLTGEVGTGKTTLIRALLEQDTPGVDVALCVNPRLTAVELLATICDELGVDYPQAQAGSLKTLVDHLNAHLLETHAAGRRTVLIIDEAQDLSPETLEQVRLLTNLETRKHKLLRIILVGQPELESLLSRPDLRQLAQRITARYHLRSFRADETRAYVQHRLMVAGGQAGLFTPGALKQVHRRSGGTPRLVNIICERALLGTYSLGAREVSAAIVKRAAQETQPGPVGRPLSETRPALVPLALILLTVSLAALAAATQWLPAERLAANVMGGAAPAEADEAQLTDAEKAAADTGLAQADDDAAASPDSGDAAAPASAPDAGDDAKPDDAATSTAGSQTPDMASPATETVVLPDLPEGNAEMAQLLRMWGVFGATVNARCNGMRIGDLRCLQDRGSFADLERYDRPALLELKQGKRTRQVLLSELGPERARIIAPGGVVEWPRSALARLWTGEYQVVWRLEASTRRIQQGSVGNSVVWLRRKLARAEGRDPDKEVGSPSPVFDEGLANSLRRFQVSNGLKPDGVVGARTMILLNLVDVSPNDGSPRLSAQETG